MKAISTDSYRIKIVRTCKTLKKRKLNLKEKFGDFRENSKKAKIACENNRIFMSKCILKN